MSEETNTQENDGTWSGLKKTIIGTLATLITGGGAWLGVTLFGGGGHSEDSGEHKTEQTAPAAQPVINVNVSQNQENKQQQKTEGGTTTIIKEKVVEKPVEKKEKKKSESEDAPW
jgi:hypothetical protein